MAGHEFKTPADALEHFGTKGMKWGVRNDKPSRASQLKGIGPDKITRKLSNGDELTLTKDAPIKAHKAFATILGKKYIEGYNTSASLTIGVKGKTVGHASFFRQGDELYLNFLEIEKSQRGQGYASEVMKATIDQGKSYGVKRLTLDVPGDSPDAQHIYKKMGFKVTAEDPTEKWGGRTTMEYKYD